jgi:hypothetical protein
MSNESVTGEGLQSWTQTPAPTQYVGTSDYRIKPSDPSLVRHEEDDATAKEYISLTALYRTEDPSKELVGSSIAFYSAIRLADDSLAAVIRSYGLSNEADKITAVSSFIKRIRDLLAHLDSNVYAGEIISLLQLTATAVRKQGITLFQANELRRALRPLTGHVRLSREVVTEVQRILESTNLETGVDLDL